VSSHSTHKPPSEREGDHEVVEGASVHTEVRYNAIVHALSLSLAFARQLPPQGAFVAMRCHLCTFKLGFIGEFVCVIKTGRRGRRPLHAPNINCRKNYL